MCEQDRAWVVTDAPVVSVVPAGADRVVITLAAPDVAGRARPGQFVMASVAGHGYDPLLRRPLSIHNVDGDNIELLIAVLGRGTRYLADLSSERSLSIVGPLGTGFGEPPADRALLLVAGGMGIAPLLFAATAWRNTRAVGLAAGGRTAGDLVALDRFAGLGLPIWVATDDGRPGQDKDVRPIVALDDTMAFFGGTVVDLVQRIVEKPPEFSGDDRVRGWCVWACGPDPMLAAVDRLLADVDVPGRLSMEAVFACGVGACAGCVRPLSGGRGYVRVCKDGPVFDRGEVAL